MKAVWGIILLAWAGLAYAAPETSLRPLARDAVKMPKASDRGIVRPRVRPVSAQMVASRQEILASAMLPASPRPMTRSSALEQRVMAKRRKLAKGAMCGETAIQGEVVGFVPGKLEGCGVKDAVRVRSVSGILLSQPSVLDCPTAQALRKWVDAGVTPAFRSRGAVSEIKVASHYACRSRNNQQGARISEHGKGRAIDISGFVMQDGSEIMVADGWNSKSTGRALRKAHKTACGPFGTVLGPNADRYHQDHFHLDTARYRSGTFCR